MNHGINYSLIFLSINFFNIINMIFKYLFLFLNLILYFSKKLNLNLKKKFVIFIIIVLPQIHSFKIRSAVKLSNCFSIYNKLLYYRSPLWIDYSVVFICFVFSKSSNNPQLNCIPVKIL